MDDQKVVQDALQDFNNQEYNSCLNNLNTLLSSKPKDHKILHNKALAEFLASNPRNVEGFQKSLNAIFSQLRIDMNLPEPPEDVDYCVLYYNQAMLHFIHKEYDTSLEVAKKAYAMIQPMEDSLAYKVCLLLLELNLLLGDPENALSLLSHMENQFVSSQNQTNVLKLDRELYKNNSVKLDPELESFKRQLLIFRAKCHYLLKSYDLCDEDIEEIRSNGKPSFSVLTMNSKLELAKRRFKEAMYVFIVIQEDLDGFKELDPLQLIVFYNNMGCLYHYLSKPHLAYFYMHKAYKVYKENILKFSKLSFSDAPLDYPTMFKPEHVQKFVYNVGVACLFCNRVTIAFDLLTEAVQVMHKSSLVWLRLAECCIAANKPDIKQLFNFSKRKTELISHAIGVGSARKLILNNEHYKDSYYSSDPQSYAIPVPTLDFASLCVQNALKLLPENNNKLKHAVLAASVYINLCIKNPIVALKHCTLLFEDETTSSMYKYLSRLYMAEALLMMDRVEEATETLDPIHTKDLDPTSERLFQDWYPDSLANSLTVMQYSLAVVLTIKGELGKASDILKHIWVTRGPSKEVPIHVISLAIYIELVLGHMDIVKTIIQQNCSHLFVE